MTQPLGLLVKPGWHVGAAPPPPPPPLLLELPPPLLLLLLLELELPPPPPEKQPLPADLTEPHWLEPPTARPAQAFTAASHDDGAPGFSRLAMDCPQE
jgi:hypothetical protein